MMGEYDAGYEHYIDSLIREIEKLQDENDRLSEQVSSLVGRSFRTADKMSCIEADNANLRELVLDMFRDFANADYELKSRCGRTFMAVTRYEPRMRELGVEVDE